MPKNILYPCMALFPIDMLSSSDPSLDELISILQCLAEVEPSKALSILYLLGMDAKKPLSEIFSKSYKSRVHYCCSTETLLSLGLTSNQKVYQHEDLV